MERGNRLICEKSPYLVQHAHNPVDWYPWGDEAFARAAREGKPIFLSIGYSACHWCGVMERESFADERTAALINETFIAIKVDREERPDIDALYMRACQMLTGNGGWPLTIFLTPEKMPFFAATYLSRVSAAGRVGLKDLIPRVRQMWCERRDELAAAGEELMRAIAHPGGGGEEGPLSEPDLRAAYEQLSAAFDGVHGGFGTAPKFPQPSALLFLLRYASRTGEARPREMAARSLEAMARGGIRDHVGGGFHRYATDAAWRVPHFEKMLSDQSLLAIAYLELFQLTGDEDHARIARETLEYALRDLASPEGMFCAAEGADSPAGEGAFSLWRVREIRSSLPSEDAELVLRAYGIAEEGNFEGEPGEGQEGANVLALAAPLDALAAELGVAPAALRERLDRCLRRLFEMREQRARPRRDEKILTDWNGLMLAALSKGARILAEPRYASAAARAADALLERLRDERGRLLHRFCSGEAAIPGFADDYAFLIWGLLELAEAGSDARYLAAARALNAEFIAHFWDASEGAFFLTADDGEKLPARIKEFYDGALPSANAVAMPNLVRLAEITGDRSLVEKAEAIARCAAASVRMAPSGHCQLLCGVDVILASSGGAASGAEAGADDRR
jgi:uncharacterized protein